MRRLHARFCEVSVGPQPEASTQRFDQVRFPKKEWTIQSTMRGLAVSRDHHNRRDVCVATFDIFIQRLRATASSQLQSSVVCAIHTSSTRIQLVTTIIDVYPAIAQ